MLLDLLAMVFFVRFRASPGHFFGRIGLACAGVGLGALGWLAWLKLGEGAAIANRPLLLFGVLMAVIGVQFVCTGIVTEMLARTYFEAGSARTYLVRDVLGGADARSRRRGRPMRPDAAAPPRRARAHRPCTRWQGAPRRGWPCWRRSPSACSCAWAGCRYSTSTKAPSAKPRARCWRAATTSPPG